VPEWQAWVLALSGKGWRPCLIFQQQSLIFFLQHFTLEILCPGGCVMTEMVLNTTALPETLFRLIQTEKVRVKEIDGMIQLMPVKENLHTHIFQPILGVCKAWGES
jgi:hypothetical protein